MTTTLIIVIIILAFVLGTYIGAIANINVLNKRMDKIEAEVYGDDITEEDLERIFDEYDE